LRPRSQTGRHLRALGLADISADNHDGYGFLASASLSLTSAPFALGAFAIASALAPQRFSAKPRGRRPAAAWCGAVFLPLLALAMARRGDDCPESRRPRARAQSARVTAVHRKEVDLDRFVAALLALATDPGGHAGRRHKPTGESLRLEQSCRQR
jgi:hypothetical protein